MSNSSPYASSPSSSSLSPGLPHFKRDSHLRRQRYRILCLLLVAIPVYTYLHRSPSPKKASFIEFCPSSSYIPTIILQGTGDELPDNNRTFEVDVTSNATFLPGSRMRSNLRFSQKRSGPTLDESLAWGVPLPTGPADDCSVHTVPSSSPPILPTTWRNNSVLFGFSTKPERILYNIPVWAHWIPSHPREYNTPPLPTDDLPLMLALIPPPTGREATNLSEGLDELQELGLHIKVRATEAPRFERRYLQLTTEMWAESERREAEEGIRTEWFVFA